MKEVRALSIYLVVALVLLVLVPNANSLNNGLGLKPQMGYDTWFDLSCTPDMNETTVKARVDALVEMGFHLLGYEYVNIDDCWSKERQKNGQILPDPVRFPSGIKAMADYVHSKGMKFGLYADRGNYTCEGRPGSWGWEKIDAMTFASWDIDYLKEDSCGASQDHETSARDYARMRDALNSTNRPIFFSLCGWNPWYAPFGRSLGNSWRINTDVGSWPNVLLNINSNAQLADWSGAGGWNDPDLLVSKRHTGQVVINDLQSRTQFNMWAIMSAPLILAANPREMSSYLLEGYLNYEIIQVNQDPLGRQGRRIVGGDLLAPTNSSLPLLNTTNVWGKPLADGSWAVGFINVDNVTHDIYCTYDACLQYMGFMPTSTLRVRDLYKHHTVATIKASQGYVATGIPALGGSAIFKVTTMDY